MKKKIALVLSILMAGMLFGGCGMDMTYKINKDLTTTLNTAMYYTKDEMKEFMEMSGLVISSDEEFEKYVSQIGAVKVEKAGKTYYFVSNKDNLPYTKQEFEEQYGRIDDKCMVIYDVSKIVYGTQDSGSMPSDGSAVDEYMEKIEFVDLQFELPFAVAKSNGTVDGNKISADAMNAEQMEDSDILYAVADENLLNGTNLTISGASEGGLYNKKKTITVNTADGVIKSMGVKINGKAKTFSDEMHPYNVNVCSEDGKYTVSAELFSGSKATLKFTVDRTKPTANVANNKTYKSGKKITFSDKTSGIKSAKLDGKTVKSGKVVKKKGTHKLVLTDRAGNKKTIKFKIK